MKPRVRDREKSRAYSKRHYENNRTAMIERARNQNLISRKSVRDWLLAYLLEHPCVDCGEDDPVVLEFDHNRDKEFDIGSAIPKGYSLKRVQAEVDKCEVRCANCHRRKTYKERGLTHRSLQ